MAAREHPAKVATPLEALSGLVVQLSAPDEGARRMGADEEVTTLPLESSTLTTGWALNATPLVELPGDVVKTSWVADPGLMVMFPEVPEVRPALAAERVYVPTVPVMAQPAKVATPAVAVTGLVVQASVPDPGSHRQGDRGRRRRHHGAAGVLDLDHRLRGEDDTVVGGTPVSW